MNRMKFSAIVLTAAALVFSSAAFATGEVATAPVDAQVPAAAAPAAASVAASTAAPLFLKPVFLRGTLGDVSVQVSIRPKTEIDEGLEGEYFVFGRSLKILLAGEMEGNVLFMEESENGTDISGQWDGKLEGDTLTGSWMSADGAVTKPFILKAIAANESKPAPSRKVSANSRKQ